MFFFAQRYFFGGVEGGDETTDVNEKITDWINITGIWEGDVGITFNWRDRDRKE